VAGRRCSAVDTPSGSGSAAVRCRPTSSPGSRCVPCAPTVRRRRSPAALAVESAPPPRQPTRTRRRTRCYLGSRSRIRYQHRSTRWSRSISRLRACWVTHPPVGWAVIPTRWTRRRSTSMTNRTYSWASPTASTVKKSHQQPAGLAAQELGPGRPAAAGRPADPMPTQDPPYRRRRHVHAEVAALPTILKQPQRGFSRASRTTRSTTWTSNPRTPRPVRG
jgi:hypothetical protein